MQLHSYRVPTAIGQRHWRFLCSDLHLGSPHADVKRLRRDLDDARRAGARVWINGDVFDAIDCRDKRWNPTAVVKELRSSHTLASDVVKYASDILEPYADLIDWIGVGNHEEKWINWNSFDPVMSLLERLNADLEKQGSAHRIRHGGICGWVRTVFEVEAGGPHRPRVSHTLYYHHGSGGDSPVTKGLIDINRKAVQFDYDAVTVGHRHNRVITDDIVMGVSGKGHVRIRERKALLTGSYYRNYQRQSQARPLDYSYATSKGHAPKPPGGLWLTLTPERDRSAREGQPTTSTLWVVRQAVSTEYLGG